MAEAMINARDGLSDQIFIEPELKRVFYRDSPKI